MLGARLGRHQLGRLAQQTLAQLARIRLVELAEALIELDLEDLAVERSPTLRQLGRVFRDLLIRRWLEYLVEDEHQGQGSQQQA